jgi:hypothetical protein
MARRAPSGIGRHAHLNGAIPAQVRQAKGRIEGDLRAGRLLKLAAFDQQVAKASIAPVANDGLQHADLQR